MSRISVISDQVSPEQAERTFSFHLARIQAHIKSGRAEMAGNEARLSVQFARVICAGELGAEFNAHFETRMLAAREILYSAGEVDLKDAIQAARKAQSERRRMLNIEKRKAQEEKKAIFQRYFQEAQERHGTLEAA